MDGRCDPNGSDGPGRWLDLLRTFRTVVAERGFTAAARRLGVSQGAVSQQMRCLERRLGVRLLVRSAHRLELTPAGERLLAHAERLLAEHAALLAAMAPFRHGGCDSLHVAASTVPGECALPRLVARFQDERPGVRVCVTIACTARVAEAVLAGEAAVAVLGAACAADRLELVPVGEDEVLAVAPGPAAEGRSRGDDALRRADLARPDWPLRVRWLQREPGSGTRQAVDEALQARGIAPHDLEVAAELGSPQALRGAVLAGEGCAFLSRACVAEDLRAGRLVALPLPGGPVRRTVYAAWPRGKPPEGAAGAFVALVRSELAGVLAGACGRSTEADPVGGEGDGDDRG